jgi:hypothetical protein
MAELRAYCYLDRLQPQFASLFASACRGFLSVEGMAALFVEIAPGIEINRLTDIALKITNSRPHSFDQEEVLHAGQMILDELELKEEERIAPKILATSVINKVNPYQAVIIRRRHTPRLPLTKRKNIAISGWWTSAFTERPAAFIWPEPSLKSRQQPKKLLKL